MTLDCAAASLRASDADEARGRLQRALARHLAGCSRDEDGAVVVLHDVANMSPEHVPALLPALSEDGAYAYDGESIATTRGVFVLTAHLPATRAAAADGDGREDVHERGEDGFTGRHARENERRRRHGVGV